MSSPSVSLIEGTHITAHDKRNILGCITFLRQQPRDETSPAYGDIWLGKKGSRKSYAIAPLAKDGAYLVKIKERYTTGWGDPREKVSVVTVATKGILPLTATRAEIIADQNDQFRAALYGLASPYPGKWVFSHDVSARGECYRHNAAVAVSAFTEFEAGNDPYGERDFGAFELEGEKLFFKIDYYDAQYRYGSEDPSDPTQTRRVLTIYFPHEH